MPDNVDYETWLKANPYPSLQELLDKYGSHDRVPAAEWTRYDRARAEWETNRRDRLFGSRSWDTSETKHKR